MRSSFDRIRHAISFEIFGLLIITPLGALVLGNPMIDIGVIALIGATGATTWNYIYNLGFDKLMLRWNRSTQKTVGIRIAHAILFELGLLCALLPLIAWYLDIGVIEAFLADAAFAAFYIAYAFAFNWAYDLVFPERLSADLA